MMSTATAQTTAKTNPEADVRNLLDSWLAAVRASDVGRILTHYAPDIVSYDAVAQLQFRGTEAYGKHWQACLEMCSGPGLFEIADLEIAAAGDVAFSRNLLHCGGTDETGEMKTSWMRMTTGYRKKSGKWSIVHEHFSVPFEMPGGKAMLGLEP
jgi:ketosteroid isomerase-like protein